MYTKNQVCLVCLHPRHIHREMGPFKCQTKHMTCTCPGFTTRIKIIKPGRMIEIGGYQIAGNSHDRRRVLRERKSNV